MTDILVFDWTLSQVWSEERELTGEWPLDMKEQINTVSEKGTSIKKRKRSVPKLE